MSAPMMMPGIAHALAEIQLRLTRPQKPVDQQRELGKAILKEFEDADRIDSVTWYDFNVIYVPDKDENGRYCREILALETSDGKQHFAPYNELRAEFTLPTEEDITNTLREE